MNTTLAERVKERMKAMGLINAQLATACNVKPPTSYNWSSGKTKNIKGAPLLLAAKALGVNPEWLASGKGPKFQNTNSLGDQKTATVHYINSAESSYIVGIKSKPDELEIPQFETGGSMGSGLLLRDQPGVIKSWTVSTEWIEKNVPSNTGAANLCIVTGFGPSMRPIFNSGDPLLVDRGVNRYEGDAIYFFRVGEEGYIKSLQSIPGDGLRVISANRENFDAWTIRPDMDFEVFGRVLKVWKSEEL